MTFRPAPDGGPPLHLPTDHLDRRRWVWRGGPYELLEARVALRCEHPDLGTFLQTLLSSYPTAPSDPSARLDILDWDGTWVSYLDGARASTAPDVRAMARTLVWYTNALALQTPSLRVHVHAAVASLDGRAVLLPGRPGAGKTTLVTALALAGFQYLSDEVAAVDPSGHTVHPYPRPIALELAAGPLLPPLPRLWPAGADLVDDLHLVVPSWLGADVVGGPATPVVLVFPHVAPGVRTELVAMTRANALVELLPHVLDRGGGDRRSFGILAGLVRSVTCWRLDLDGVRSAATQITELVHSVSTVPGD
jgi:energy-coupling factor transporter ATP-binding protein EcfA2